MNETNNWLIHDHRKYDEMLTECEIAAEMAEKMKSSTLYLKKRELMQRMLILWPNAMNSMKTLHDY